MEVWRKELYLAHHGILGQKWGKRNGPPYPLDAKDHSAAERKAGYTKSITIGSTLRERNRARWKSGLPEKSFKDEMEEDRHFNYKDIVLKNKYGKVGAEAYKKSIEDGDSKIKARSKAERAQKREKKLDDMDHSKSSYKQFISEHATWLAYDLATMNAVGLVYDGALMVKDLIGAAGAGIREKSAAKRKAGEEKDSKTGFALKAEEMTKEKDLKSVNPGFKNLNDNTKNNCMLCTATYDLRRRGYDVTANKASYGYTYKDVKRWYPKAELKSVDFKNEKGKTSSKVATQRLKSELESQGVGARGNLMVEWKRGHGSGHSMAYEVTDKGVMIFDAQSGKTYKPEKILSRSEAATYARLDNVDFDPKTIKECAN